MKLFVTSLLIGLALGAPKSIEKDLETVPYTIVATHHVGDDSFEERDYEGGLKWVCTKSKGNDNGMFQKLYQYIAGANSENENIDMTIPVSTKWDNTGVHEECFYLNKEHQLNPPKPSSPDVYIITRPAMTIYTRKISKHFWHQMTVQEWMKESADLDKMIESLGFKAKSDEMYVNGYTSPMAFNQRSELWKIKETEKSSYESLETVPYTVIATHHVGKNSFEERNYEGDIKWVCTKSDSDGGMFMKLFQYISGANSENENIDMTTPVSTKWESQRGSKSPQLHKTTTAKMSPDPTQVETKEEEVVETPKEETTAETAAEEPAAAAEAKEGESEAAPAAEEPAASEEPAEAEAAAPEA